MAKDRTPEDQARGQWLRAQREALGISQSEVSRRARLPESEISKIENGWVEPRTGKWIRLLRAVEYDAPWLRELDAVFAPMDPPTR